MTSSSRELCFAWMMGAIFGSALTGVIIFALVHGASQLSCASDQSTGDGGVAVVR
jgi:hypothetical protein